MADIALDLELTRAQSLNLMRRRRHLVLTPADELVGRFLEMLIVRLADFRRRF